MDNGLQQDARATPTSSYAPLRRIPSLAVRENDTSLSTRSGSASIMPALTRKAFDRSLIAKQIPAKRSLTLMLFTFAASVTVGVISAEKLARYIEHYCVDTSPKSISYFPNDYGFHCSADTLRV